MKKPDTLKGKYLGVFWVIILATIYVLVRTTLYKAPPEKLPHTTPAISFDKIIDVENMTVLGKSDPGLKMTIQDTHVLPSGSWSMDKQVLFHNTQKGSWVEFALPALLKGRYLVTGFFTKSYDYGVITVQINGHTVGPFLDLWSPEVIVTGPVDLGKVELTGEKSTLRFTVAGRNPANSSPYYQFGVDGIALIQQ